MTHRLFSLWVVLLLPLTLLGQARFRVLIDNDLSGDPDGLFQLAHQLLSPSTEVRGIIGSFHYDNFYGMDGSAQAAAQKAQTLLSTMTTQYGAHWGQIPIVAGRATRLTSPTALPESSLATSLIINEAMRDDRRPLYYLAGAGLTNLAAALLLQPEIASRLTLVWIGGEEYKELCKVQPRPQTEYNTGIDIVAAQVVFDHAMLPIWQVPRDIYRQCIYSLAELYAALTEAGTTGAFLYQEMLEMMRKAGGAAIQTDTRGKMGETYVLGDSPLTLLTALQTAFEADPASSDYCTRPRPRISDKGRYLAPADSTARNLRVYTRLDLRLMIQDFYAKLRQPLLP